MSEHHLNEADRKAREFDITVAQIVKNLESSLATDVIGMQTEDQALRAAENTTKRLMLDAGATHADASAHYAWSCPYRWVEDGIDMMCETEFEHPLHFHKHPFRWIMVLLTGHAGRCPMHMTKLEQVIRLETSMRMAKKIEMVYATIKVV